MKFPKTLFVSIAASGNEAYLDANETEVMAIKHTDDELTARVAEYKLVKIRKRTIVTTVQDARCRRTTGHREQAGEGKWVK